MFKKDFSWLGTDEPSATKPPPRACPPLEVGQCATYFFDMPEGRPWVAVHLQIVAQLEDDVFHLVADVKRQTDEMRMHFKLREPTEVTGALEVEPVDFEPLRGSPSQDDAMLDMTIVMNMILAGRGTVRQGALEKEPRSVDLECEIDKVFVGHDPWPEFGYDMEHFINPRIYITGLARSRIVGRDVGPVLTSFGSSPPAAIASDFRDYADLTRLRTIDHHSFRLTYPATWIFRRGTSPDGAQGWMCEVGGAAHTVGVSIIMYEPGEWSPETAENMRAMLRLPRPFQQGLLHPKNEERIRVPGGEGEIFFAEFDHFAIDGLHVNALITSSDGQKLVRISGGTCYLKDNPRRTQLQKDFDSLLEIVRSFEFPPDA